MHMIDRNSPCWCGSGLKYKKCHYDFDEKLKMYENKGCIVPEHNMIKTPEQIEKIKDHANWALTTVWGIGYKFEVRK